MKASYRIKSTETNVPNLWNQFKLPNFESKLSKDSYEYPGEIVILKGFEEATTDGDNNEEGDEF